MTDLECPPIPAKPWAFPASRLLLRADAPRGEWLQHRRSGLGSSDASGVLGVTRWTSPYEVWADKLGLIPETPDNDNMELGRLLEPLIADRWSAKTGIRVRKVGLMQNRDRPWQLASVDRAAACGGLVEIKTLSHRVAEEWEDGQTPDHAEAQSQHQMAVTGRSHVHVVGLQDGRTWLERLVMRDDVLGADMTTIESTFWHDYVLARVEPPIDGSDPTTDALNNRWAAMAETEKPLPDEVVALLEARAVLAAQVAELESQKSECENRVRQMMGDATVGVLPGLDAPKVTWRRNGTFKAKQFAQDHPDVVAELTRPAPQLDMAALKRDYPELYAQYRSRTLRLPVV